MATHFSTLTWNISWTEGPDGLHSRGSQRVSHDWTSDHILYHFIQFKVPKSYLWTTKDFVALLLVVFAFFFFFNFYFLAKSYKMQDLSSLTRDQTCAPCIGSTVLTTGLTGKSCKGFCNLATVTFPNLTFNLLSSPLHSSYTEHPPILVFLHLSVVLSTWSVLFSNLADSLPLGVYVSARIRETYPESTIQNVTQTPPHSERALSFFDRTYYFFGFRLLCIFTRGKSASEDQGLCIMDTSSTSK